MQSADKLGLQMKETQIKNSQSLSEAYYDRIEEF